MPEAEKPPLPPSGQPVAWRMRLPDGGCTAWFDGKPPSYHGSYEIALAAPQSVCVQPVESRELADWIEKNGESHFNLEYGLSKDQQRERIATIVAALRGVPCVQPVDPSRDAVRNEPTISPDVKRAMEHFWKLSDQYKAEKVPGEQPTPATELEDHDIFGRAADLVRELEQLFTKKEGTAA